MNPGGIIISDAVSVVPNSIFERLPRAASVDQARTDWHDFRLGKEMGARFFGVSPTPPPAGVCDTMPVLAVLVALESQRKNESQRKKTGQGRGAGARMPGLMRLISRGMLLGLGFVARLLILMLRSRGGERPSGGGAGVTSRFCDIT